MPCGPCPKHGCFQIVVGLGYVARRWCKGIHVRVSSGERVRGGGGRGWWAICWEEASVVGCSWSLSLASLRTTVVWSGFFRVHFLRWLWMSSASISCLTLVRLDGLCCTYFVGDFLTGFSRFMWAVVRFYAYWAVTRFAHEMLCFSACSCIRFYWDFSYKISCFAAAYLSTFHAFGLFRDFHMRISYICFLRLKRFREIWLWDVMILRSLWEVFVRFVAVCCVILSWDFLTIFYAISCFVRFPAF